MPRRGAIVTQADIARILRASRIRESEPRLNAHRGLAGRVPDGKPDEV
jgi:hypothetical protein